MGLIKRAYASITRRATKSLIMLLTFLLLFTVLSAGISIANSVHAVRQTMKEILGARVTMIADQVMNYDGTMSGISQSMIASFGSNEHVKFYDANLISNQTVYPNSAADMAVDMTLYGYQYQPMVDVETKKIHISEGAMISQESLDSGAPEIVVSKAFADQYGLSVGDDISMNYSVNLSGNISTIYNQVSTSYLNWDMNTSQPSIQTGNADLDAFYNNFYSDYINEFYKVVPMQLKIVGLFELESGNDSVLTDKNGYYSTRIYLSNKVMDNQYTQFAEEVYTKYENIFAGTQQLNYRLEEVVSNMVTMPLDYESVYILHSIDDVQDFLRETRNSLPGYIRFIEENDGVYAVNKQMATITMVANSITVISLVASLVIVPLVLVLFYKERVKEFGIYLSLGIQKVRIIVQVVIETLLIGLTAIGLSLFTGSWIAQNLSQQMIDLQFSVASVSDEGAKTVSLLTADEIEDKYAVKITPDYVFEVVMIGTGTLLVSSIIPVAYITRLKPKKILL